MTIIADAFGLSWKQTSRISESKRKKKIVLLLMSPSHQSNNYTECCRIRPDCSNSVKASQRGFLVFGKYKF